ncbi:MAG: putative capsular polysaccharide synthesis family protein [Puniceicoccaceae bacterium]
MNNYKCQINNATMRLDSPVVVYQMGKVGSSSIYESLRRLYNNKNVYHVHYLNPKYISRIVEKRTRLGLSIPGHIQTSQLVRELIRSESENLKFISLVRDPFSRNLSAFFENIDNFLQHTGTIYFRARAIDNIPNESPVRHGIFEALDSISGREYCTSVAFYRDVQNESGLVINDIEKQIISNHCMALDESSVEGLIKKFISSYNHKVPLLWFDREPKIVLGIDVLKQNFEKDSGFSIYKNRNFELLVLKCEIADYQKEEIVRGFLNIDRFELEKKNVGTSKHYNNIYKIFQQSIRFPQVFVDHICSSEYVKHFYSDEEIHSMMMRWS